MLRIPRAPDALALRVERGWDGAPCDDARLHAEVRLQATPEGLAFEASLPHQPKPRVPAAPRGARVANLWEYDVVECFVAGRDGRYLELELGAGGHFLALQFDAPRRCCDALESLRPKLEHRADALRWTARLCAPWAIVPAEIRALNAFVAAGGRLLAHHPLPGARADFHQPQHFPAAALAEETR
ncbi:MAG TPA: hypothetical protein VFY49_07155 [Myxococcota bacterium]|nr:hypothetical protein [Myxococcota bacterium]